MNSRCRFKKTGMKQSLSDNIEVDIYPGCLLISSGSSRAVSDAVYSVLDIKPVMIKCHHAETLPQLFAGRRWNETE